MHHKSFQHRFCIIKDNYILRKHFQPFYCTGAAKLIMEIWQIKHQLKRQERNSLGYKIFINYKMTLCL